MHKAERRWKRGACRLTHFMAKLEIEKMQKKIILKIRKSLISLEPKEVYAPNLDRLTPGMMSRCGKNLGGKK